MGNTLDYSVLIAFSLATATLAIAPGPDNIYVLVQSISNGKKYGLATVAGLMSGCLVHTSLLAFGVSALIRNTPSLFLGIKVFGAVYLLYLAYQVFKSDGDIYFDNAEKTDKKLITLYRQGFVMNVLNPKVTIFFLAFFPGFLFSKELDNVVQFYVLGLLFILVSSFVFGAIAILSGSIGTFLRQHQKTGHYLKWLQIIVFVCLALYLILG
ncbi:LysE family translocator [Maribacter thermophilus]|uniref:LysE family translocator n=1 Tax=Maribacter thermophilus TaxID=1197874 RepID=UPI000A791BC3|nr:LysE family translocator [Maribacter thermophilus]